MSKERKPAEEMTLEELSKAIDDDSMRMGHIIAGLYKTLTIAMGILPDMELHTETICLSVNDEGITVHVGSYPHSGSNDETTECDGECDACDGCDYADDFERETDED